MDFLSYKSIPMDRQTALLPPPLLLWTVPSMLCHSPMFMFLDLRPLAIPQVLTG